MDGMIALDGLDGLPGIRHGFFTRVGGVSEGIYDSKNCGFGSNDARENVARNRARCLAELDAGGPALLTAFQIHSAEAVTASAPWSPGDAPRADAMVTDRPGLALGILTADCAPVLFCDAQAGVIGAAHAGWKGALGGVLEATVGAMADLGAAPSRMVAGIGPHIGQASYEVGPEFVDRFAAADPANRGFFAASPREGHALFDLGGYIESRLAGMGLARLARAGLDTCREEARFFSYRRASLRGEGDYGRCLSAIVMEG
jgi:hypothetical protein